MRLSGLILGSIVFFAVLGLYMTGVTAVAGFYADQAYEWMAQYIGHVLAVLIVTTLALSACVGALWVPFALLIWLGKKR